MLKLIQTLADCDNSFFTGWILARAEIKISHTASIFNNELLVHKPRKAIMRVIGKDTQNNIQQELTTLLLLPKQEITKKPNNTTVEPQGKLILKHQFTNEEIYNYILLSGDKNIIHQTKNPIVPGLYMALLLQTILKLTKLHWQISFLKPVFANDIIYIYQKDNKFMAYVDNQNVFNIIENK